MRIVVLAMILAMLVDCARPPQVDLAAAERAIREADVQFSEAAGKRDLEGFKKFLAADATTLRPDAPVIHGRDAFAERWVPLLTNPELKIRWEPLEARVAPGGDFGYTLGKYEITRTDAQTLQVVSTGKYVTIWQKQTDGAWKVVHDSGVQDSPPQAKK